MFVSTIILELGIRFTTDKYASYPERNGQSWYQCPYDAWRKETSSRLEFSNDARLYLNRPHSNHHDIKTEFNYVHRYNSIGIRDDEVDSRKLDSSYVIIGLGDSFTEGVGTIQDSSWVKLLSFELDDCHKSVQTVNAGIMGSDIVFETYKLKHFLNEVYRPELVIFAINNSDIIDIVFRGGSERFVSENQVVYNDGPWWKYLYSFSYICRVFVHEALGVNWTLQSDKDYGILEEQSLEILYSTIINEILPYTSTHHIKTLFVFTPLEYELDEATFAFTELSKRLNKEGINVLNLHEDFSKYSDSNKDYYWDLDMHCNSNGYLLWSKAISDAIRGQNLIDC